MSDREEKRRRSRHKHSHKSRSKSRSRSRSPSSDHSRSRSRSHGGRRSRSNSRSYSRSPRRSRRSHSGGRNKRSNSRSPYRGYRSRSRSRDRYRHRSSNGYRDRHRYRSSSRSPRRMYNRRDRSTSPLSDRRRHVGNRENPDENCCIGVFGLSLYTTERDLKEVYSVYGPLESCNVVYDHNTGRSRGFSFVTFNNVEDARDAKVRTDGMEIDGRRIRVDFSITRRAHTPTPGIYMGQPTYSEKRRFDNREYSRSPVGGRSPRARSLSRSRSGSRQKSRKSWTRSRSHSRS